MSEIAEKTADVIAENVEDVIDGAVEVARTNPAILVAVGALGLVIGGASGYFLANKKLIGKYEKQMAEEMETTKQFYAQLYKVGENGAPLSPQEVLAQRHGQEAAEAAREYQGRVEEPEGSLPDGEPHDDIVDEEQIKRLEQRAYKTKGAPGTDGHAVGKPDTTVNHILADTITANEIAADSITVKSTREVNVFRDDTFDLEEEIKFRTLDKPYIITHDEFYGAEKDYDTHTLTYYVLDDTLTDEHDKPLEQTDKLVGDDHLLRFGSGSKDQNIVFVRNDRLGIDYEIIRSKGSYLEEVLGMPNEDPGELKHSDQRDRRRAMRHDG